jgi:hypothetical protein
LLPPHAALGGTVAGGALLPGPSSSEPPQPSAHSTAPNLTSGNVTDLEMESDY